MLTSIAYIINLEKLRMNDNFMIQNSQVNILEFVLGGCFFVWFFFSKEILDFEIVKYF